MIGLGTIFFLAFSMCWVEREGKEITERIRGFFFFFRFGVGFMVLVLVFFCYLWL